jgi:hypothetical protein
MVSDPALPSGHHKPYTFVDETNAYVPSNFVLVVEDDEVCALAVANKPKIPPIANHPLLFLIIDFANCRFLGPGASFTSTVGRAHRPSASLKNRATQYRTKLPEAPLPDFPTGPMG